MKWFSPKQLGCWILSLCAAAILAVPLLEAQQEVDPDSLPPNSRGDYNPYMTLYRMNSWSPVLDHNGVPHEDGHLIQIIADGGNGIQDPPNLDGSPGGDDGLAEGNFSIQFLNGAKHEIDGLDSGAFMGMRYFVPYNINNPIYLRLWEGTSAADAEYYQDSEGYTTVMGDRGGGILHMKLNYIDDVDWQFGPSRVTAGDK